MSKPICPECQQGKCGKHGIDLSTPCIDSINKPNPTHGYALRVIGGRRVYEHVAAWEEAHGPIPKGLVVDHLCHDPDTCPSPNKRCPHRRCRNILHLSVVTRGANVARGFKAGKLKTRCPQGHPYDEVNTYVSKSGSRQCRTCTRAAIKAHKARKRMERSHVETHLS